MQIRDLSYLLQLTFIPKNVGNPAHVRSSASERFLVYQTPYIDLSERCFDKCYFSRNLVM